MFPSVKVSKQRMKYPLVSRDPRLKKPPTEIELVVYIEIFWTEGYAGQTPNSGHELAIYVSTMTIEKL